MNKNKLLFFLTVIVAVITIQGCLSVETKEYTFKIKNGKSGSGVIKYINIMSDKKDSISTPENDYSELIDSYIKGDKTNDEMPGIKNVKKRLFEEDNQLCGELSFDFDDFTKLKLYRYKDSGPWCYYLGLTPKGLLGGTETYFSSNGNYGGEEMPVIFWDGNQKELNFKTTLSQPSETTVSLIDIWKKNNK